MKRLITVICACLALQACAGSDADPSVADGGAAVPDVAAVPDGVSAADANDDLAANSPTAPPVELTPDLCDDPSLMAQLAEALGEAGEAGEGGEGPSYGEVNEAQFARMAQAPTDGPFYMVNLIRFRDEAQYPDGRETDLTGREANDLYAPTEFIEAIGARPVFVGEVDRTTLGGEGVWDQVAIVEYPCPLALFAMSAHPEFQARSIHKEAGVEASIVMVTHLQPLPDGDPEPTRGAAEDPAFELVQVVRHRAEAQYDRAAGEPPRSGQEAMALYSAGVREAAKAHGLVSKARFRVQGVFIGDGRSWDEVWIDQVPGQAAFEAFLADPEVVAHQHHFDAALEDGYGLVLFPFISAIPGAPAGGPAALPVTTDGTGALCQSDADCPGEGVDHCLVGDEGVGFCTREGCGAGECERPYLCCHDCAEAVAAFLPFEGSACVPEAHMAQLREAPVSCTCD